jgi:hypothetical protein
MHARHAWRVRAAQVVMTYHISHDPALLDSILSSLAKAGLFERAGELYEYLNRSQVRPQQATRTRLGGSWVADEGGGRRRNGPWPSCEASLCAAAF